jgi:hypothetical protein
VRISKPIHRWIEAIDPAYYDDVVGVTDEDNYYCSIGDVTVDGIAYTNVVLVYNFSTQTWRVRTYAEQPRAFANYIDSSGYYRIMLGNDDGDVQIMDYGDTDAGSAIFYRVQTKKMDFGSSSYIKRFSDIFMFGDELPNAQTFIKVDDNMLKPVKWTLTGWFKRIFGLKNSGRRFTFELAGTSTDGQGVFEGWELPVLVYDGYID